jgi:hypothetical protein
MRRNGQWWIPWNRVFLGMRLSNWCMIAAGVITSALVLWIDPP